MFNERWLAPFISEVLCRLMPSPRFPLVVSLTFIPRIGVISATRTTGETSNTCTPFGKAYPDGVYPIR